MAELTTPAAAAAFGSAITVAGVATGIPPDLVLPQAQATFSNLTVHIEDDDHMLHRAFPALDWPALLT